MIGMNNQQYDPFGDMETEEERRRRLAEETSRKQTIEQSGDGTVTVKTEETVPTEAMTQPVMPEMPNVAAPAMAMPELANVSPVSPVAPMMAPPEMAPPEMAMPELANVSPVDPQAMMPTPRQLEQQRRVNATALKQLTPMTVPDNTVAHVDLFNTLVKDQKDPLAMLKIRQNEFAPKMLRTTAGEVAQDFMRREVDTAQAKTKAIALVERAGQGDMKASSEIAKTLGSKEGSWLKMLLLSYISPEMAGEEAIKLGYGNKWGSVMDAQGNPALIEYNARGKPLRGKKGDGSMMTENELISYAGGKKELDLVGGTFVNDATGEVGRVVTDKKTGASYIQTDTGRKPLKGFRPQSSAGTLDAQSVAARQKENIKLAGDWQRARMSVQSAGPEAANKFLGDVNAKLGTNYTYKDLAGSAPQIDIATNRVMPGQATAAQAPQTAQIPAQTAAQVPQTQQAAPQVAATPIAPTQMPIATQQATMPLTNVSPQAALDAQAAAAAGAKKATELIATDAANTQIDQPKTEAEADRMITLVEESVKADGFSDAVGFKGVASLFGLKDTPFEGSDAASWMARYGEIKGGAFLKAFEALKGGGAISDAEGAAATKAITRMSEATSEKEFKIAAKEFADNVKLGVDINRAKLGQKPLYGTPKMSERKKDEAPLGSAQNPIRLN